MNITRTIRTPALLIAVVALLLAGLTLPAQAAVKTGAVKGVVTLDGKPVKSLKVELYRLGNDGLGKRLGVNTTNSKGAYSFSKFPRSDDEPAGSLVNAVVITDPSGRIVATSRKFRDRPGKTTIRNVSVKAAASITGVVARGDGRATAKLRTLVSGPPVDILPNYDTELVYDTTVPVAKDGSFKLGGLPAGDYYLEFLDEGKTYFSQCYDNLPTATTDCNPAPTTGKSSAATITVRAGQNIALNPQTLSTQGRRITGTVTDTSGRPIRNARVLTVPGDPQTRLTAFTSKSGTFTVGPVTDGSYRLKVDPSGPWAPLSPNTEYNANGQDVTGVQIKLKSRANIKAKLTPGKGTAKVAVDITRSATGKKPSGKVTIRWGTVTKTVNLVKGKATATLSGLPKGQRTLTVSYAGTSSTAAITKTFRTTVK